MREICLLLRSISQDAKCLLIFTGAISNGIWNASITNALSPITEWFQTANAATTSSTANANGQYLLWPANASNASHASDWNATNVPAIQTIPA